MSLPLSNTHHPGAAIVQPACVSVVIPCYNHAHFLGEAIESALQQAYAHIEIVVVDDGSHDNTAAVAARYRGVRYIRQHNQGLAAARNTGLHHATGSYLVFLDADDRLDPHAVPTGIGYLETHPAWVFVSGHYRLIAADGSLLREWDAECVTHDHYAALLQRNYIGMHATVMYRRAPLEAIGGFDPALPACEDYDVYLRLARHHPVGCHNQIIADYRQHTTNMSRNAALMLRWVVTVLHAQRSSISGKRHLIAAYRAGIRSAQAYYGRKVITNVYTQLAAHHWSAALRDMQVLLRYYPCGFLRFWWSFPVAIVRRLRAMPPSTERA